MDTNLVVLIIVLYGRMGHARGADSLLLAFTQIVQSRTFGSAAREGGVGVRMLVPLADLLNHGGDEAAFLLHHKPTQTDNVRYATSPFATWCLTIAFAT